MEGPIKVKILGQEYLLRCDDSTEKVHKIAEYVNRKFKEINREGKGLTDKKMAILVAFSIASDYLQLEEKYEELLMELEKRLTALILRIEEEVE